MKPTITEYLPFYIGCEVQTPDGIGKLVGIPWDIVSQDSVTVHFGSRMIHTKNSVDGYDKRRNHGRYLISAQRLEPINSSGITEDGFDLPGGVTPILRPLESMTEEEKIAVYSIERHGAIVFTDRNDYSIRTTSSGDFEVIKTDLMDVVLFIGYQINKVKEEREILPLDHIFHITKYLCEQQIDVFNLHSQGLCLYKNEKGELY